ncbi:hypothetical protein ACJMK2_000292 [Sinanodonta woodiana]|uniref:SAND domain-containing protein n=1 Tax=Sinanodonta woodiana TaxID=1069815 RepID=A0ABD3XSC2_SINWO
MGSPLDDDFIEVSCGSLIGRLHRERFICPGINRECIEHEGRFVTPKAFYIMGDKASLKDWKNAIRINGKKIRKYIDSGELDFYNHKDLCTGKCKSRAPAKSTIHIDAATGIPYVAGVSKINEHTYSSLPDHSIKNMMAGDMSAEYAQYENDSVKKENDEDEDVKPNVEQLNHMLLLNLQQAESKAKENGGVKPMNCFTVQNVTVAENELNGLDDDQMFWKAIVELGLIDEFFREIKSSLDILKNSMIKNFVPLADAKHASCIVNELGLRVKLDYRLSAHKTEFDRQQERLEREMQELKKRVAEYEHKKQALKRKSDCFEQLMHKKGMRDRSDFDSINSSQESLARASPVLTSQTRFSPAVDSPLCSPCPSESFESSTDTHSPTMSQESFGNISQGSSGNPSSESASLALR